MLQRFVTDNRDADVAQLALHRNRYPMLSDSDFRFGLQQIEGRQRTREKLPTFATIDGWLYPPRLNLEQCSSERTARFKASVLSNFKFQVSNFTLIDATGGYGVDTFFMSEIAAETHYYEQNVVLAAIAEHNFRLAGKSIVCHAEAFNVDVLSNFVGGKPKESREKVQPLSGVLYLDPARRDSHGGKVFRLEDCTPNVVEIVRYVQSNYTNLRILLKLSPMLDYHQAMRQLGGTWDVSVVSVNGEVKELLLSSEGTGMVNAVALIDSADRVFSFTQEEESAAEVQYVPATILSSLSGQPCEDGAEGLYLYEPDAAILKAGAFRLVSARYGLLKAAPNTHLYFANTERSVNSQNSLSELPGRQWKILGAYTRVKDVQRVCARASVLTRNYVLPADALHKQLRLKDGGDEYIIGCRIADKPLLLHCRRV